MTLAARKTTEVVWQKLTCSKKELRLDVTLMSGQSFRWKELKSGNWTSVLAGHVWTLRQCDEAIYYRVHTLDRYKPIVKPVEEENKETPSNEDSAERKQTQGERSLGAKKDQNYFEQILWDYFQLDVNLHDLYDHWSEVDPNFRTKAQQFPGVRILRQEPVENLFSFICSSNNNISRISLMVEKMCEKFGEFIAKEDGLSYYGFPMVEVLVANSVQETLRNLGFGYRAKYISESARFLTKQHGAEWLYNLRSVPYEEAKCELMKLCGVGAKVADCVCLMSLDKHNAVPVDTHVWQIVNRDYKQAHLNNTKNITNTVYKQIGDFFRELWGDYAGWAQSVLFSADLKKFKTDSKTAPKQINTKNHKCSEDDKTTAKRKRTS